jgi:hypothetical protein
MKPVRNPLQLAVFVLACLVAFPAYSADFKKGQKVWSKHQETPLLSEPKPLAAVEANIGFAVKLSIREVQGSWLRVKSKEGKGWVFQGNVASDKPSLAPGAGWTVIDAAQTDTVAAARPLTPAAEGYAQRHGSATAQSDLDWLDAQAALVTSELLVVYMTSNQLGEYQQ